MSGPGTLQKTRICEDLRAAVGALNAAIETAVADHTIRTTECGLFRTARLYLLDAAIARKNCLPTSFEWVTPHLDQNEKTPQWPLAPLMAEGRTAANLHAQRIAAACIRVQGIISSTPGELLQEEPWRDALRAIFLDGSRDGPIPCP